MPRVEGRRYLDLVPGVFPSEDGHGFSRDVGAECWTEINRGSYSVGNMTKKQAHGVTEEGFRSNHLETAGSNKWCAGSTLRPQKK